MAGINRAEEFVREVLADGGPFRDIGVIAANAGLFSALAKVVPEAAVRALERIILPLDADSLRAFTVGRREIMWSLERLVAHRKLFPAAARLMLRLAVAENESYANNATGTFQSLFKPRGGATAATGIERAELLTQVIDRADLPELLIAVGALEHVFDVHGGHMVSADPSGAAPPTYWAARTLEEHVEYCGRAFVLLEGLLNHEAEQVRRATESVVLERFRNFFWLGLSEQALTLAQRNDLSESVRRRLPLQVDEIFQYDDDKWFMTEELANRLRELRHTIFADPLRERLHLRLGTWNHDLLAAAGESSDSMFELEARELTNLAEDLLRRPELLQEEFQWITSSEAVKGSQFIHYLGRIDADRQWLDQVLKASLELERPDLIASYINGLSRSANGDDVEELLDRWAMDEQLMHLIPAVTADIDLSEVRAKRLVEMLGRGLDPQSLVWLTRARCDEDLTFETLSFLLRTMAVAGHQSRFAVWGLIGTDMAIRSVERWTDSPIAVELLWDVVGNTEYLEGLGGQAAHSWSRCANVLAKLDAERLVKAITAVVIAEREHLYAGSYVRDVLEACFDSDPSGSWSAYTAAIEDAGVSIGSWALTTWGAEAEITERVGLEILRPWAEAAGADRESRVGVIAKLATVATELTPVIRWLVTEYGHSKEISAQLMTQHGVRAFWGGWADAEQPRLDAARQWVNDDDPAVRRWAHRLVEDLEQEIAKYRVIDEESDIRR